MNLLLDTHTFIWFINGDKSLSDSVTSKIKNFGNQCFFSMASFWEIAIKMRLNKLHLKASFDTIMDFCDENEIEILPITFEHIQAQNKLEHHHRDPFDRVLIAQGIVENLTILTKDENFKLYNVNCLW